VNATQRPAPPRLYVDLPLAADATIELPPAAARHAQVLRLQPGSTVCLFDGRGGEAAATVLEMGRRDVRVRVGALDDSAGRELPFAVTLALGVPANDRMDALVEKATELGVATIVPLVCERSVLRLEGDRAARRLAHWQAVAVAACEQCGRNRVPVVEPVSALTAWLRTLAPPDRQSACGQRPSRWLLSPRAATALPRAWNASVTGAPPSPVVLLSGPEGGFAAVEEALAQAAGFQPVGLGSRVLRADTAPLAALAWLSVQAASDAADAAAPG
jgi:16S rRNA (uracil1498-N3)-methyltransferase